jgi:hypothetical protein
MKRPVKIDVMHVGVMAVVAGLVLGFFAHVPSGFGGAIGGAVLVVYAYYKSRTPPA